MNAEREHLELWREMTFGIPATLTIGPLIAVQSAWRSSDDYRERMRATLRECRRQGHGLWEELTGAGVKAVAEADAKARRDYERALKAIEKAKSPKLAEKLRTAAAQAYKSAPGVFEVSLGAYHEPNQP